MIRIRTVALAVLLAALVAAIGYGAYWFRLAGAIEDGLAAWAAERRAEGWEISYQASLSGFPGDIRLDLASPAIARPDGWRWRTDAVSGSISPFAPGEVALAFPGRHRIAAPGWTETGAIDARSGSGRLSLDARGAVREARASLSGIALQAPGLQAAAERLDVRVTGPAAAGHALADVALQGVEWAGPTPDAVLERRINALDMRLRIHPLPRAGGPSKAVAADWQARGGRIDILELALDWPPMAVEASGQAALDEALQPTFRLDASLAGMTHLLQALRDAGRIGGDEADTASMILALMTKRDGNGRNVLEAPLSLRGGRLFLGPLAVAQVPRLEWQELVQ